MPKMKTHKSIVKRFSFTASKKVMKRYCGQDHFNSRDSGNMTRKKRRDTPLSKTLQKTVKALTNNL